MHTNNSSVISFAKQIHQNESDKLEVYMFNVGQGDHLMMKFPTNEYGIIDFFFDSKVTFEPPVLTYFKKLKKELNEDEFASITISFICISHNDKDHIKGASETIEWLIDNKVYIRNFWLCGGKSEFEYFNFFNEKIINKINALNDNIRVSCLKQFDKYRTGHEKFYQYFNLWKKRKIKSDRYTNESRMIGNGEILVDIKSISKPSYDSEAVNLGPLSHHIEEYQNELLENFTLKILNIKNKIDIDRNETSHIIKLKFGENNIIFGGDTHIDIWKDCLNEYFDSEKNSYFKSHGEILSRFIKVSHHGSKNSSCTSIWNKIIPISKEQNTVLGISAGQNKQYNHPNEKTLSDLKGTRNDCEIYVTNICLNCTQNLKNEKLIYDWLEDDNFSLINNIGEAYMLNNKFISKKNESGLFAYIFEISRKIDDRINVKLALSKQNVNKSCFYSERVQKLDSCNETFELEK